MRHIVFLLFFMVYLKGFSHDPNHATLIIESNGLEKWEGTMTFSTFGLQKMLANNQENSTFQLSDSKECKKTIEAYIKESLRIKLNKFSDIRLDDFVYKINDHATEITFVLTNVPSRAEYWLIEFDYLSDLPNIATMLQFMVNGQVSKFLLKDQVSHTFRKEEDHIFKKVSTH